MKFILFVIVSIHYFLGVATSEWSIGERIDDFSFNVTTNNETPFYYLSLDPDPYGVLEDIVSSYERIDDNTEKYTYKAKCQTSSSYRVNVISSFNKVDEIRYHYLYLS